MDQGTEDYILVMFLDSKGTLALTIKQATMLCNLVYSCLCIYYSILV